MASSPPLERRLGEKKRPGRPRAGSSGSVWSRPERDHRFAIDQLPPTASWSIHMYCCTATFGPPVPPQIGFHEALFHEVECPLATQPTFVYSVTLIGPLTTCPLEP